MFGNLMILIVGFWVSLFNFLRLLDIFWLFVRCLGKLVRICFVKDKLLVFIFIFVVFVNWLMIGSRE